MKLTIQGFTGMIPRLHKRMLPDNAAQSAMSCLFETAAIIPMREADPVATPSPAAQSFYQLSDGSFLTFLTSADVDVVEAPIAAKRYYLTGNTAKPQMYFGSYYDLALFSPSTPPTLVAGGVLDPATAETVVYAYTWVTSFGEETPPSPLSAEITVSPLQTVTLSALPTAEPVPGRGYTTKRIYRSKTSFSGATELFYVADVALASSSYVHSLSTNPLAEAIQSRDYDAPPNSMKGITAMPNGVFAAFSGKEVLFSEPYIPHAWPEKYRLAVNDDIVALCSFGTSVAVLTTGTPYIIQGLHPDSMAMTRLESVLPCVSKTGVVDLGYAAVYPSTDGLVEISAQGARLVSQNLWTPEQWRDLQPDLIVAAQYRGGYAFIHRRPDIAQRVISLIVFSGQDATVTTLYVGSVLNDTYKFIRFSPKTGKLLALSEFGNQIVSINDQDSDAMTFTWRSKVFRLPGPVPFGVIYVDAEETAGVAAVFQAKIYANGVLIHTETSPNEIKRIPPPSTPTDLWEVELISNYTITRVILCGDPSEVWQ